MDKNVKVLQEHSSATYYGEVQTCAYNPSVGILTVSLDTGILEYHVEVDKKQLHLTNFYEKHDEHIDKTMHALRQHEGLVITQSDSDEAGDEHDIYLRAYDAELEWKYNVLKTVRVDGIVDKTKSACKGDLAIKCGFITDTK